MVSHLLCTLDFLKMVKKKKKAFSRTAIIPMFPFTLTVVFESLLFKEKPQLKFINIDH